LVLGPRAGERLERVEMGPDVVDLGAVRAAQAVVRGQVLQSAGRGLPLARFAKCPDAKRRGPHAEGVVRSRHRGHDVVVARFEPFAPRAVGALRPDEVVDAVVDRVGDRPRVDRDFRLRAGGERQEEKRGPLHFGIVTFSPGSRPDLIWVSLPSVFPTVTSRGAVLPSLLTL